MGFLQGATGNTAGSPTTTSAFGTSTTSGNLIVVSISDDSALTNNGMALTDSKGNTYVKVLHVPNASTLSMWYCANITGGASHTLSATWSEAATGRTTVAAQEFDLIALTSPLDKSASGTGSSTSPSSGATAATTQPDELVVTGVSRAGTTGGTISLGSGFTNLTTVNVGAAAVGQASKVVSSTGAQTGVFTLAASRAWVCRVLTFTIDAGGSVHFAGGDFMPFLMGG